MTDKEQARRLAWQLIASYPMTANQPENTIKVLHGQLTTLLTGISVEDAEAILHPQLGMPGRYEYPSAYNCNKWLEGRRRPPKVVALPAGQEHIPPTPEEKERVSKMVSAFKAAVALDKSLTPNIKHVGPKRSDAGALLSALRREHISPMGEKE